jgi:phthiodiolone/phenolphthiodiolone dimycocerosates ketoreductase
VPPIGINRFYAAVSRFARVESLWGVDHQQFFVPGVLWDRTMSWTARHGSSPHDFFDYATLLGYLAANSGRLRLGIGVTDPIRRHPVLTAQTMLTLAHMTRRAPILGLGTGLRMNLTPYGLSSSDIVSRLKEAVQIIRACFTAHGPITFHGTHYRLDDAVLGLQAPKGRTPGIWIAGNGPRMLQLSGQLGDGWLPALVASPEEYSEKLQVVTSAARSAGRDPDTVTPSLWQSVLIAPSEQTARRMLETRLVRTLSLVYSTPADWHAVGSEHPFGERYRVTDLLPEQIDRDAWEDALMHLPPELLGYGFIWGTAEQVAARLRAYGEAGLRHAVLCDFTPLLTRRSFFMTPWTLRTVARLVA